MKDTQHRSEDSGISPLKPNRQVTVLLVCFLIAIVFWLLLALSSDYSTTITVPVQYKNMPTQKVVVNELPDKVAVQLRTSGFSILGFQSGRKPDGVTIDVSSGLSNSGTLPDVLAIPTRYFLQDFTRSLGEEVSITGFRPDSIVLLFKDRITRKVPVMLDLKFTLFRQFDTVATPFSIPDSVELSGPPSIISRLSSVSTQPVRLDNLKQSVFQPVGLVLPPLVTSNTPKVKVNIPVEEFTEGRLDVPISYSSVPSGYVLKVFPENARVRYQVPLSKFNSIEPKMFEVVVDASGLPSPEMTVLPLRLTMTPEEARNFMVDPSEVEFILRKK